MTTQTEALKLALEALEKSQGFVEASANAKLKDGWGEQLDEADKAITAIKQVLARPEREPVSLDVTIDDEEALALLRDMVVQSNGDLTSIRLVVGGGHLGYGLYVASAEYQEEGAILLVGTSPPQPKEPKQKPMAWIPTEQMYPQTKSIDILMGDGSILCAVLPQFNGDLWWEGSGTGEKFIDPKYANVTHWRIHGETTTPPPVSKAHKRKPWVSLSEEDREQHRDSWRSNIHDQEIKALEAKLRELNEAPQLKPLTGEQIATIWYGFHDRKFGYAIRFARAIEAAHNIKE